jgi:hypothetical protein
MTKAELRQTILNTVGDCAADFCYYDRKEDEDLSRDDLYNAVADGVITVDEIVDAFRDALGGLGGTP